MKKITIAFFCLVGSFASAQDGLVDAAFGTGGVATVPGTNVLFRNQLLPDGKILYQKGNVIKRLTATGQVDAAFGASGGITLAQPGTSAYYRPLVQGEKILAFSNTSVSYPSTETYYAGRYNTDGTIDTTFGNAGTGYITLSSGDIKSPIATVLMGNDLILAGNTVVDGGSYNNIVARKLSLADGSPLSFNSYTYTSLNLDNSSQGYGTYDGLRDVILLPNGDCVLSVSAAYYSTVGFSYARSGFVRIRNGVNTPLIRIHSDNAYYGGVKAAIATDASSNIYTLTGASFGSSNQPFPSNIIYKRSANDVVDPTFGNGSSLPITLTISGNKVDFSKMAVQPDAKILLAGVTMTSASAYDNRNLVLARFLPSGDIDTTFGNGGYALYDIAHPTTDAGHNIVTGLFLSADSSAIYLTGRNNESSVVIKYGTSFLNNGTFEDVAFDVYPNPTSGVFNVASKHQIDDIGIYNMLGQKVFSKTVHSDDGTVDISGLQQGTYMAKVTSQGKTRTVKVVKR